MALHGKEKIWFLFNRLIDARDETVGDIVGLHPMDDLHGNFSHPDFINLLSKLEYEKVAKFISLPTDQTYLKYQVKILPGFDAYAKKLRADTGYRKWCGIEPDEPEKTVALPNSSDLTITYTNAREILLNGMFQLAKPNLDGENDIVFKYLYDHPNQSITKAKLEAELKIKVAKPFHKIVENLGFKSDLSRAFFSVSKTAIEFRNPVTKDALAQLGITRFKL
jgi:hypothetical protein